MALDTKKAIAKYRETVETYNSRQVSPYMCASVHLTLKLQHVSGYRLKWTNVSKSETLDAGNKAKVPSESQQIVKNAIKSLKTLLEPSLC